MTGPLETHDRAAQLVQYRPRVYRHLLALTRDPALADDLTQETFLRAVSHIGQLREHDAALGWLYRIATNTVVDHARRARGADAPADLEQLADTGAASPLRQSPGPSPQTTAERSEMSACVDRHLASLPGDYRVALLLHDGHGLTNPQIAAQLQCSVATVKIRVHRARARLRAALTGACDFGADERGELVCEQR
jgi:RNA polymerase sigma-70 factor, ECF subfamily